MSIAAPVHVVDCAPGEVDRVLPGLIEALGIEGRLEAGKTAFVKPNLVTDVEEYIANGANTSPELVIALCRFLRDRGMKVLVGESETGTRMKGRKVTLAFERSGLSPLVGEEGIRLVNLTEEEQVDLPIPGGVDLRSIRLARCLAEADLLFNLPTLKTHKYAGITCALKNMFGCIPDPFRIHYHRRIHGVLADLSAPFRDRMIVLSDGMRCMEGAGPLYGRPVDLNVLVASTDCLAHDAVCARLMGFDPCAIRHLSLFAARHHPIDLGAVAPQDESTVASRRHDFEPAHKNWFIRLEEQLMWNRTIVRILFSDFVRKHFTYRLRGLFAYLRGGSYSWYVEDETGRKR